MLNDYTIPIDHGQGSMKLQKLLKTLNKYLNAEGQQKREKDEGLSEVLKKLKKKELKLQERIEAEKDEDERRILEQEMLIVHGQREKGIALLSEIRGRGQGD